MTEQTPLERLEYEMRCIGLGDVPDSPMFERVRSAAIAYIKHAEARIKELEAEVQALHETPLVSYFLNPKPKEGNDDN